MDRRLSRRYDQFSRRRSLDLATFAFNIEKQIEAGVHGIIVCGSLGENSTLTFDEKLTLLETAKKTAGDKVPVHYLHGRVHYS